MLTVGSLFAGIGGLELGLEWTHGFTTRWQVECDPYAQRVLAKHWPDCGRWDDVRTFPPPPAEDWRVDLICGGFPCQDISYAGKGAGLAGERSGLFYEAIRVVRLLQPRYVLLENVAALLTRGLGDVLGTLASIGYDAEWHCIPAAYVGAPHIRDRVFVLAYANCLRLEADANESFIRPAICGARIAGLSRTMGCAGIWTEPRPIGARPMGVGDGIPVDMDRLRCLGNAVVPQVAYFIGQQILNAEHRT